VIAPHLAEEYAAAGTNAVADDVIAFDSPEIVEWQCATCTHTYSRSALERVTLCGVDTRALEAATSGSGPLSVAALARLSQVGGEEASAEASASIASLRKVLPHESGCPHCAADFVAKARRFGSPHAIPQSVFDEMVAAGTNDPFPLAAALVEAPKEREEHQPSKARKKAVAAVAVRPVANPSAEFSSGFWCASARSAAMDDVPLSAATTRRFDFCCPQCTNTFTLRLCDRVAWARTRATKGACPHCAEASVAGAATRLEPEWHPSKNGDLTLASLFSAKKGATTGSVAAATSATPSTKKAAASLTAPPVATVGKKVAIAGVKSKSLDTPVWWICSQCAHEWLQPLRHRLRGDGCPECALAKKRH
jgi:hypothetical protein